MYEIKFSAAAELDGEEVGMASQKANFGIPTTQEGKCGVYAVS